MRKTRYSEEQIIRVLQEVVEFPKSTLNLCDAR